MPWRMLGPCPHASRASSASSVRSGGSAWPNIWMFSRMNGSALSNQRSPQSTHICARTGSWAIVLNVGAIDVILYTTQPMKGARHRPLGCDAPQGAQLVARLGQLRDYPPEEEGGVGGGGGGGG